MRRAQFVLVSLALAAGLAGCAGGGGVAGPEYFVKWIFVNNSSADVTFTGSDRGGAGVTRSVPQCGVDSAQSSNLRDTGLLDLDVTVSPGGRTASTFVELEGADIRVRLEAVWDGTNLNLNTSTAAAPTPGAPATSENAESCQAPTTWKLDGVTGNATLNFQNQVWTLSGTLSFAVPPEVEEGQTYNVSATFSGSATANPGFEGSQNGLGVNIVDVATGLAVLNIKDFGSVTPTASGSVTVTGFWVIPANQSGILIRTIRTTGSFTHAGPLAQLVATYSKQP